MALGVGFGDDGQFLARPRPGNVAGKAGDPLDAGPGKDRHIHADLDRQAAMRTAAHPGIFTFGIFADDDPIDGLAEIRPQRANDAGQQLRRPHIGELIEALADGEAQAPQRQGVRQIGIAHRAEIDRLRTLPADRSPSLGIITPCLR